MRPTAAQEAAEAEFRKDVAAVGGTVISRTLVDGRVRLVWDIPLPESIVHALEERAVRLMGGRLRAALESVEPKPPERRLLTPEEFGQAVGVSRASVYRMIQAGLPAPKVPHVGTRIDLEQGQKWMVATGMKRRV